MTRALQSASRSLVSASRATPRVVVAPSVISAVRPRSRPSLGCAARVSPRAATAPFSTSTQRAAEPIPPRRSEYKKLDAQDVAYFRSILASPSAVVTTIESPSNEWQAASVEDLVAYNSDWMDKYHGNSPLLLKPRSTDEVSKIMKYCYEQSIAVVPQGGNTGLVGGGVPVYDELILSTEGMNSIREFDEVSGTLSLSGSHVVEQSLTSLVRVNAGILTADGGAILESLSNFLHPKGYMMPLDLGAKGSCHIAGNISTNAGGLRLLRYGSLHGTVLGIEAVLPDANGTVLSLNMPGDGKAGALRKDNTGYDLKQLFIGAEGTLGIVTGVSIMTPRLPSVSRFLLFRRFWELLD